MKKKILALAIIAISLLFTSCYPELSVQQYDELKDDLKELDVKRAELEGQVAALQNQIAEIQQEDAETKRYIKKNITFLEKMISTQSSERILTGEFDVESLVEAKDSLIALSENMSGTNINYYLDLMDSENQTQTVAAYYKVVEYCFKEIREALK